MHIGALSTGLRISKSGKGQTSRLSAKSYMNIRLNRIIRYWNIFVLTPITRLRYDHPIEEATVKFNHILLFALSGGLVILCSLFNYLTLFVSRIRMRGKEIALRKVCGSSDQHLMGLFSIEYLLTLLAAIFIGMLLIELVLPTLGNYPKSIRPPTESTWKLSFIRFLWQYCHSLSLYSRSNISAASR